MARARVSLMVLALAGVFSACPARRSRRSARRSAGFVVRRHRRVAAGRHRDDHQHVERHHAGAGHRSGRQLSGDWPVSRRPYQVNVQLSGFAPETRTLTLTVGADAKVDFKLKVAGAAGNRHGVGRKSARRDRAVGADVGRARRSDQRAAGARSQLPRAGADAAGVGAADGGEHDVRVDEVRRPADQRNGYTTLIDGGSVDDTDLGQSDRQRQPGRGPGVQGLPQPVRRAVRRGAGRGGQRGHQVGHEPVRGQRLLLRPRSRSSTRRNAFATSKRAVRSDARRRVVRRPDRDEPDALLRRGREAERQQHDAGVVAGDQSVRDARERRCSRRRRASTWSTSR